jgi:3-hydroxyisobutyrate dehydrogenase
MKVGFMGLGVMGTPMADNLARGGVDLRVWNRTADKAQRLARTAGCAVAASPADLARDREYLRAVAAEGRAWA